MSNDDWIQDVETKLKHCQKVSENLTDQGFLWNALSKLECVLTQTPDHVYNTSGNGPQDKSNRALEGSNKDLEQYRFGWARTLMDLELVRTEESSFTERRIQETLDKCLDHVGLRVSFLVGIEILTSVASSSSTSNKSSLDSSLLESSKGSTFPIPPKPSQASVISSMHTIRRLILSLPTHNQEEKVSESNGTVHLNPISYTNFVQEFYNHALASTYTNVQSPTTVEPQFNIASNVALELVNILIRLHTRIASASYACQFKLPLWATRIKLSPRLIVCALYSASVGMEGMSSDNDRSATMMEWSRDKEDCIHVCVFSKLVQQMVHQSTTREVASGIHHFWVEYCHETKSRDNTLISKFFPRVLHSMFDEISSPRECASLLRSILVHTIQQVEIYPTTMTRKEANRICTNYCMPYLKDCCLGILEYSSMVRESFVHLLILSPSPSGEVCEQRLLTRCVVLLLASCTYLEEEEDSDYSSDDDSDGISSVKEFEVHKNQKDNATTLEHDVLLKDLCTVSKIWCEPIFTTQTDQNQQRHVTEFLLDGLDFIKSGDGQRTEQQKVIQELIQGVTNRLKVSDESVRIDGMQVAERIAPILGQSLKFDELDEIRENEIEEETTNTSNKDTDHESLESNEGGGMREKKVKKRHRKEKDTHEIDPDEEYKSESDEDTDEDNDSDSSSTFSNQSIDSVWDEDDLVKYDLSDNEEDLRVVQKPTYLLECLELLRTNNDDQEALCNHKVALEELPSIIRSMPANLPDFAGFLARELLHYENKFDSDSFLRYRWEGLLALTVCEPTTTLQFFTQEVFGDVSLGIRFEILDVMKQASTELSGGLDLERKRNIQL